MTIRRFQVLVALSLVFYLLLIAGPYLNWPQATADEYSVLQYDYYGAPSFTYHPLVFVASVAMKAMASIGLILFFTWGRRLFALWLGATLVHTSISGLYVVTAVEAALGYGAALLDGFILAFAYSTRFQALWRIDSEAQSARGPAGA